MLNMRNKLLVIMFAVIMSFGFYIAYLSVELKQSKNDNEDLQGIISNSEKQEAKRITDKKGREHLKTEVTTINDTRNLKEDPAVREILKFVDAKFKNIKLVSTTSSTNNTTFITHFKDSTRYDTIPVKCIDYQDTWISIKGCDGDSMRIIDTDTLSQVIFSERKKILFLRIGKKKVWSQVYSSNPNRSINVNTTYINKRK